mgnify:FL=1
MGMGEIIAVVTGATAFWAFVQFLISRHDAKEEKENSNEKLQNDMLLGLAHDRILFLTDKYIRRKAITLKEKRNLEYLYRPYRGLHGNGDCQIGYEECQKLPIVSDEEALEMDSEIKRKTYNL